jgi:hypothetical protein
MRNFPGCNYLSSKSNTFFGESILLYRTTLFVQSKRNQNCISARMLRHIYNPLMIRIIDMSLYLGGLVVFYVLQLHTSWIKLLQVC